MYIERAAYALYSSLTLHFFYFRGNPKLTTSINHLLIWICCFCLLESTLGVAVKALILQGTVSSLVDRRYISMVN